MNAIDSHKAALRAAIADGFTIGQAIQTFAEFNTPADLALIERARGAADPDLVDIPADDHVVASMGDDSNEGFVLAWVWVESDADDESEDATDE